MVLKPVTVFLLLVLTVSQAFAASVSQRRSPDIIESRQTSVCPTCTTVLDDLNVCKSSTTLTCLCNPNMASNIQSCIDCTISVNPTPAQICLDRDLIDLYTKTCSGIPGVPALRLPPGTQVPTNCPPSSFSTSETASGSFAGVFAGIGAL